MKDPPEPFTELDESLWAGMEDSQRPDRVSTDERDGDKSVTI